MTYLLLNICFLVCIGIVTLLYTKHRPNKLFWLTLLTLTILTLIFDSLIIMLGIVGYTPEKVLGVYLWRAPIEDFAYTIASALIVVLLWEFYEKKSRDRT